MRAPGTTAVLSVALAARLAVVAWAHGKFPAAGDGTYYDVLARRLAHGDGYTWLWPDGAVTFAAHYPVGYPGLLAAAYATFGASVTVAMILNAVVGALGAAAVHRLALGTMRPALAFLAGLAVALHPALVPYTVAIMTEGVTASLVAVAAALAAEARFSRHALGCRVGSGLVLGLATLVRPQCLVLGPILGAGSVGARDGVDEARREGRRRLRAAALVLGVAVACCLPWTARNCVRMQQCALVSVNGGWNLLIGAETDDGAWAALEVPFECREVWGEADKDACFSRAARRTIRSDLGGWLEKVPAKLARTFDYVGAAPWYMHASNPGAFDDGAKVTQGALETVVTRLFLLCALAASALLPGPRRTARWVVAALGAPFAVLVHASVGYLALALALALRGLRQNLEGPLLPAFTCVLVTATALVHAVFFGAGRYGLVVLPFVAALAASLGEVARSRKPAYPASVDAAQAVAGRDAQAPRREESPSSTECDAG